MTNHQIEISGARVNNLKDVDLTIPHGQWVSFCGVSGSGKSSLAIDTLYAEGQRRYLESLSPGKRMFVQQLDRPDADRITGIPPAIAIQPHKGTPGKISTVGLASQLDEHLVLLFAKIGKPFCPNCQRPLQNHHPESVAAMLADLPDNVRYLIAFPTDGEVPIAQRVVDARRSGYGRIIVGNQMIDVHHGNTQLPESVADNESLDVVVDRLTGSSGRDRVRDSVRAAFHGGEGTCIVYLLADRDESPVLKGIAGQSVELDGRTWNRRQFSRSMQCDNCGSELPSPEPNLFRRSHGLGRCEDCEGTGQVALCDCQNCLQTGLNATARSFRIADQDLGQVSQANLRQLSAWMQSIDLTPDRFDNRIAAPLFERLRSRVNYLTQAGLGYLTLNRTLRTLSAGELQRVSLTSVLGSTLVNMLYVLDEPSIGLHANDLPPLIEALTALHARGNTLVVLDHDAQMIQSVQRVVELGPEAGAAGGEIVFDGSPEELIQPDASLTGEYLAGRRGLPSERERRKPRARLKLVGATGNNLKNITVEFPLGCLCVVTGVSGAGKSSLVRDTLYGALMQRKQTPVEGTLPYDDLFGDDRIDEIVLIDQSPIGRSARSNPVTYIGAFDEIRRAFAETVDAKTHNIKAGKFSFNVAGGRCDKCEGGGQLTIDMQFMPDVYVTCDQCRGMRYRDEVLAVRYRGKNIDDVLSMTAREAFSFFRGQPKVQARLKGLIDVGLSYIQLGQPATQLSTGEAQRLKLAQFLTSSKNKRALFLMDEPTIGLHMNDVVRLTDCFSNLLSVGHSLIVVEHNLQLSQAADWVIDLGPGAADDGGRVVAEGTPEQIARHPDSITGKFLAEQIFGQKARRL